MEFISISVLNTLILQESPCLELPIFLDVTSIILRFLVKVWIIKFLSILDCKLQLDVEYNNRLCTHNNSPCNTGKQWNRKKIVRPRKSYGSLLMEYHSTGDKTHSHLLTFLECLEIMDCQLAWGSQAETANQVASVTASATSVWGGFLVALSVSESLWVDI